MIYKLDNVPIESLGARPGRMNYFAMDGVLDLPRRVGKTEHDWGTSIEPFIEAEDIKLDGRRLLLRAVVHKGRLDEYTDACIACKTLSFDYDSFSVVCGGQIETEEVGPYFVVDAFFWQNDYKLKEISITPSASGLFKIDDYDLNSDFGIYLARRDDLFDIAGRIEVATTEFYTRANYRGLREVTLRCSMRSGNFEEAYDKMSQFQALLMRPGLRQLSIRNNNYSLYFKDGMTTDIVVPKILQFNLKGICV